MTAAWISCRLAIDSHGTGQALTGRDIMILGSLVHGVIDLAVTAYNVTDDLLGAEDLFKL